MIGELPEGLKEDVLYSVSIFTATFQYSCPEFLSLQMHPRLMHGEFMRGTSRNLAVSFKFCFCSEHRGRYLSYRWQFLMC